MKNYQKVYKNKFQTFILSKNVATETQINDPMQPKHPDKLFPAQWPFIIRSCDNFPEIVRLQISSGDIFIWFNNISLYWLSYITFRGHITSNQEKLEAFELLLRILVSVEDSLTITAVKLCQYEKAS